MSKMSELSADISELKHCGETLIAISEKLTQMFSSDFADNKAKPTKEQKVKQPVQLSITDVRKVLAEKSRNGHTVQVKELLIKYGADKLSKIDPSNYAALLADAEVL